MAIIQGHAMQSSSRGFYPKTLNGSLRFNDDDSAYLSWTPASAGNRKTWTMSFWFKKCKLATDQMIWSVGTGTYKDYIRVSASDDKMFFVFDNGGTYVGGKSAAVLRDPSAWYHLVIQMDTVNSYFEVYLNGEQIEWTTKNAITADYTPQTNSAQVHNIGRYAASSNQYWDGYLAEFFFIDGTKHEPTDFAETKNGVWVPKNVTSTDFTMGTNGFHLTFEDDATVEAFNTVLYKAPTSNTEYDVTGFGFTPDLLWIKNTDNVERHFLFDSVRGVDTNKALVSNSTAAEGLNGISGTTINLNSDGFTINESSYTVGELSYNGRKYVAWGWDAGDGNPVSNTDGSITSTVKASTTNGFSIVSYTGTATAGTIGHGLSSAPTFIITKPRNGTTTYGWRTYHESLGNTKYILLNSTDSAATFGDWNNTSPTSTVFSVGSTSPQVTNESGTAYIAYCWHDVAGVSKFGSYTGGTNGQKITTNFKVGWVLIKRTSSSGDSWAIFDNTRSVVNDGSTEYLFANLSNAEASASNRGINFLDDGFELVGTDGFINQSGTYIYAAFADTRDAAFWLDQSSNNNDWQPVNLDHNDTLLDSPTDNYATWNPIGNVYGNVYAGTFSEGNLRHATSGNPSHVFATMALPSSGKTYWECTPSSIDTARTYVGVVDPTDGATSSSTSSYGFYSKAVLSRDGSLWSSSTSTHDAIYTSYTNGDTIMLAWDGDTGKLWFGKNGTWMNSGNPSAGTGQIVTLDTSKTWLPYAGFNSTWEVNFGQLPFKYTPPA